MKIDNPEAFNIKQEGKDTIITLKDTELTEEELKDDNDE